ncbi:beta-xylosidase family glycoside hydrolase [Streptomyces violaceus]|uniref:beta-xylosidase family glycoside hydrolase n=1 Tax=Streptomyces violaceus TaxID=1936 RepID=UPI002E2455F8
MSERRGESPGKPFRSALLANVFDIRTLGFTGAFAGLWAWDVTGGGHHADFDG